MFKRLVWRIRTKWFSRPGPYRFLMKENPDLAGFNIGDKSYGKPRILFPGSGASLSIGKYTSIADDVVIMLGGEHRSDLATTSPLNLYYREWLAIKAHPITKGDVIIGNDVWIGREALILSGVTIGNGVVIGAKALVTKDVAPYSIVGGNPARHIRFRFPEEIIAELIEMAWWDWPEEIVREAVPYLLSENIHALIDYYHRRIRETRIKSPSR
ncbi:hypothetical protein KSMBR1_0903 [Candidatus Kuenenia stuttgartiensis]|uniref:Uncharacterized protein n=2 Tax=Kuenenia stuttgartiensis TaxID=174633 RepID=A0A2C9CCA1_KUEST|nr:CatB-related O-acetyltransferase [Candidatus Kuenenia stuttgartiensis]SOH03414.1 hypothetical protein KSMBR1_0903 [Candidatus Kuenenia stuttgartiensis]